MISSPPPLARRYNAAFADSWLAHPDPSWMPAVTRTSRHDEPRAATCYFGASARAVHACARRHGYTAVNVSLGHDLVLARDDAWPWAAPSLDFLTRRAAAGFDHSYPRGFRHVECAHAPMSAREARNLVDWHALVVERASLCDARRRAVDAARALALASNCDCFERVAAELEREPPEPPCGGAAGAAAAPPPPRGGGGDDAGLARTFEVELDGRVLAMPYRLDDAYPALVDRARRFAEAHALTAFTTADALADAAVRWSFVCDDESNQDGSRQGCRFSSS